MSIFTIAYNNFKNNVKTYTMFFISMVFSVVILSNFLIFMNSNALEYLDGLSSDNTKTILLMVSIILSIFIFFFLWYASNVFLRNRKKEIGIYTFMGLDSVVIGKIYFVEMMLIGLSACLLGTSIGMLISKLFQMIVFKLADFDIDVRFNVTTDSIIYTVLIFMGIFLFFSIKGLINIIRSKVIDLLNENKKNEVMPKINIFTYIIALISLALIIIGYYLVLKDKSNALKTLIFICIGTYGLFGSVIPVILNIFINKKNILYKGENIITINNLAYRIRKNYSNYATISILTAASISVLGTAVAMKTIYNALVENNELYTISFYSNNTINDKGIEKVIKQIGDKKYEVSTTVLKVKGSSIQDKKNLNDDKIILSYSQLVNIIKTNGNEQSLSGINEDMVKGNKIIYLRRPQTLFSTYEEKEMSINNTVYEVSKHNVKLNTLGSILNYMTIVVNDEEYERLKESCEVVNFYGIKVDNEKKLLDKNILKKVSTQITPYVNKDIKAQVGIYENEKASWLKAVYAIGAFLFLVFILALASIIYIKISSDGNEDRNKYKILSDIGITKGDLNKVIVKEISLFYIIPLIVGLIHSYVAIKTLEGFLAQSLTTAFLISGLTCVIIFFINCIISIGSFKKIVNLS